MLERPTRQRGGGTSTPQSGPGVGLPGNPRAPSGPCGPPCRSRPHPCRRSRARNIVRALPDPRVFVVVEHHAPAPPLWEASSMRFLASVGVVLAQRPGVDRRQLPHLEQVVPPVVEALELHLLPDRQPELEQVDVVLPPACARNPAPSEEMRGPRGASSSPPRRPPDCTGWSNSTCRRGRRPVDIAGNTTASSRGPMAWAAPFHVPAR